MAVPFKRPYTLSSASCSSTGLNRSKRYIAMHYLHLESPHCDLYTQNRWNQTHETSEVSPSLTEQVAEQL